MVTLQILVLPFLVRVRIPQHKRNAMSNMLGCVPFFVRYFYRLYYYPIPFLGSVDF